MPNDQDNAKKNWQQWTRAIEGALKDLGAGAGEKRGGVNPVEREDVTKRNVDWSLPEPFKSEGNKQ